MKKFLLLAFLLGLPSPLFAAPTDGYKKMEACYWPEPKQKSKQKISLWKKEHTKSKKWGTYVCDLKGHPPFMICTNSRWIIKGVPYDKANNNYEGSCKQGFRP